MRKLGGILGRKTEISASIILIIIIILLLVAASSGCSRYRTNVARHLFKQDQKTTKSCWAEMYLHIYFNCAPSVSISYAQITPWEAFKAELKFALKIWVTTKPVHNRISESSASSKRSSKSRAVSESATNALHGASSMLQLDKDSNFSTARH